MEIVVDSDNYSCSAVEERQDSMEWTWERMKGEEAEAVTISFLYSEK